MTRSCQRSADKKTKKALIISIIALVLVVAIVIGVIFVVNSNTVSAAELQSGDWKKRSNGTETYLLDGSPVDKETMNPQKTVRINGRISNTIIEFMKPV